MLGQFAVADAGHGIVAARQAEQRGRGAAQLSLRIENEDPRVLLVDDHERQAVMVARVVVPRMDDPVRDVPRLARGALVAKIRSREPVGADAPDLVGRGSRLRGKTRRQQVNPDPAAWTGHVRTALAQLRSFLRGSSTGAG